MSIDLTQLILNKLENLNFEMYELYDGNYKLTLVEKDMDHQLLFKELQTITRFLMDLDVKFLVDTDGSIIIK